MSPMLHEIESQGEAWREALDLVRASRDRLQDVLGGKEVRFLGAGSSYYLGNAAVSAWAALGLRASSVPASEPLLYPDRHPWGPGHVAVAISRSGSTTETLEAMRRAKQAGAGTVLVTTVTGAPMLAFADLGLVIAGAAERATVQTRSFSAQLMAVLAVGLQLSRPSALAEVDALWKRAPELIQRSVVAVAEVGMAWDRAYFLGTGTMVGLAQEGALKLKEAALTEAEAFQTLEFRHGPKSMVDPRTLVVGLLSREAREQEWKVLREMRDLGAQVLAIGEAMPPEHGMVTLSWGVDLPVELSAPMVLPALHHLAYRRALARGISPDHPRNLSFAVELEGLG